MASLLGVELRNTVKRVASILRNTPNQAFDFYRNDDVVTHLAEFIVGRAVSLGRRAIDEEALQSAWGRLDFWVLAELLDDILAGGGARAEVGDILARNRGSLYRRRIRRFRQTADTGRQPGPYRRVDKLEALFVEQNDGPAIFWTSGLHEPCAQLFEDIGWRLEAFIDTQADLPGINSLVREGLVKALLLPDERCLIAKRNNPDKEGRFHAEQCNIEAVARRLKLTSASAVREVRAGTRVRVIRPLAVTADSATGVFWSFSVYEKHPTLEQVLLGEIGDFERRRYLRAVRTVLEYLYENGIIWVDMAPRNVLVEDTDGTITFALLDFEKTLFTDGHVPTEQRIAHVRRALCVEEFSAICSLCEVEECFRGYFDPDTWDLKDPSPVDFPPKKEVEDVLAAEGILHPTVGEYHSAELVMAQVRFPFFGTDGRRRLPLHTSFKVNHYLGADYDCKTTRLFMRARLQGALPDVVDALDEAIAQTENALVITQFAARVRGAAHRRRVASFDRLSATIDHLYSAGATGQDLSQVVRRMPPDTRRRRA